MIKAKYTVVLKALMDNPAARAKLDEALSKYPLYVKKSKEEFIPAYIPTREQLNNKILNHYKYREIGFETVGRFLDELQIAMEEIMPTYNLLFLTADQDFNIIWNVDYIKEIERHHSDSHEAETNTDETGNTQSVITSEHEANDTQTLENSDKSVKTGTPQGRISTPASQIDTITHADEVDWNKANGTTSTTNKADDLSSTDTDTTNNIASNTSGSSQGDSNEIETTKGNFGVVSAQDLILKYRETIINIEQQIINDPRIQELFMLVY